MTNDELKQTILNDKKAFNSIGRLNAVYIASEDCEYKKQILDKTSFLSKDVKIGERVFCITNNVQEVLLCPICNSPRKFYSYGIGYRDTCGNKKCQSAYNKRQWKEKYNVENISQLQSVKEKKKKTSLEKYGTENVIQAKEVKQKALDTIYKKYNVYHPMQNSEIKEKLKKTCESKYGVPNVLKLDYFQEKARKTREDKYGDSVPMRCEESREKSRNTCREKYNVDYAFQSEEVKRKAKETVLKKYNVEHCLQNEEIFNKARETCKNKFSAEYPMQNKELFQKARQTCLEKYDSPYPLQNNKIKEKHEKTCLSKYGVRNVSNYEPINQKRIKTCVDRYGVTSTRSKHLKNVDKLNPEFIKKNFVENNKLDKKAAMDFFNCSISVFYRLDGLEFNNSVETENEIYNWIKSMSDYKVVNRNRKALNGKELDIYVPSKKLAIEYDGIYWHCDLFKDKKYHLNKTEKCEEQGIQLLHIFENEWVNENKKAIWESIIKNKLGIIKTKYDARKCEIKEPSNQETRAFLEENHLQGYCPSSKKLGLYHNDELVSIMTLGKSRFNKKYDWELLRFCNKKDCVVRGAADKLLSNFRKNNEGTIISYANRRWSNGNLYEKLNFKLIGKTSPNYFYFKNYDLHSRVKFQKHKLKDILETFDEDKSEYDNMMENGFKRIYDCGQLVYVLN